MKRLEGHTCYIKRRTPSQTSHWQNGLKLKSNMAISTWLLELDNIQSILLCFVIFIGLFWYFKKPKNIPPGPFSLPFTGNAFTMMMSTLYGEQLQEMMTRLAKKYGRIFSFGMGSGSPLIILSDPALIKEAFQKPELSDRTPLPPVLDQAFNGGRGRFCV